MGQIDSIELRKTDTTDIIVSKFYCSTVRFDSYDGRYGLSILKRGIKAVIDHINF